MGKNSIISWLRSYKKSISAIITLLSLLLITYYIIVNIEHFQALSIHKPSMLVLLVIGIVCRNFTIGMIMGASLRPLGVRLRVFESFGLANITFSLIRSPQGREGSRSVDLPKEQTLFGIYSLFFDLGGCSVSLVPYCFNFRADGRLCPISSRYTRQ